MSSDSPLMASARLRPKTSPGSVGFGGVPVKISSGLAAWFVAGTMSSIAFSVRICASSNTNTSTSAKPRPNPRSRAPNRIREPLWNSIASSPEPRMMRLICALTFARRENVCIEAKVSEAVRNRCAVQITVNPGNSRHSAKTNAPIRNVLPTCRGIEMTTPPIDAA